MNILENTVESVVNHSKNIESSCNWDHAIGQRDHPIFFLGEIFKEKVYKTSVRLGEELLERIPKQLKIWIRMKSDQSTQHPYYKVLEIERPAIRTYFEIFHMIVIFPLSNFRVFYKYTQTY